MGESPPTTDPVPDPLPEALAFAQGAAAAGVGLKLVDDLAVRVLVPGVPPRPGPDIAFGCLSRGRTDVAAYLERSGCAPDRRFNSLNGDRQMYFTTPSGRPVDVMVDRLTRCHVLDFRATFGRQPLTLDAIDLLLVLLQVVTPGENDVREILRMLSALPLGAVGDRAAGDGQAAEVTLDTSRFGDVMAADWGWWRTVTGNLAVLPELMSRHPELSPGRGLPDPLAPAGALLSIAQQVPKSIRWKLRASVGDRVRWYEVPADASR